VPAPEFKRGGGPPPRQPGSGGGDFFEFSSLSDGEKLRLCEGLLGEFGARNVSVKSTGEIIHSCVLPFGGHAHGDANASASLNFRKLTYNCFGCGSSGGLLWFIAVCRGLDSGTEARKWLAEQTGIGGVQDLDSIVRFIDDAIARSRQGFETIPIPRFDVRILEPWRLVHPYLTEFRHIPVANVVKHNVGWDGHRIIIPHFWRGNLVGWQARRLVAADGGPKYKNTPDFPRDSTIYNFDPKAAGPVVVVESPMSVLARTHQVHIEATFGATVTEGQLRALAQHPDLVIFFDQDKAGYKGTETLCEYLSQYTSKLRVVVNPYADADAADLDDETFETLVAGAVHWSLWSIPDRESLVEWRRPDAQVRLGQAG